MENHDRYLEIIWGCHYAGLVYTAASSRLQSAELEYIINDCGARAYITSKYKADQAAEVVADDAQRRAAADARRHDRRLRELRGRRRGAVRRAARRGAHRRAGHALLVGHDRHAEGHLPRVPERAARGIQQRGADVAGLLFGVDDTKRYLSPAPFYHAAPLRFCMSMHMLGATIVAMENFDAEELSPARRRARDHPQPGRADDVRAHAQARLTNVRSQVRRVVARVRDPRRSPVPDPDQEGDHRLVRTGRSTSTTPAPRATGSCTATASSGSPTRERSARRSTAPCTSVAKTARRCPQGQSGHGVLRRRRRVRVPQRSGEDEELAASEGLVDARRRRLSRRGRVPLPDRPQGLHDHLGRGEHLSRRRPRTSWSPTTR